MNSLLHSSHIISFVFFRYVESLRCLQTVSEELSKLFWQRTWTWNGNAVCNGKEHTVVNNNFY